MYQQGKTSRKSSLLDSKIGIDGGLSLKLLQEYCINEFIINGLKTYIISPEHYENLLHDTKLLKQLSISGVAKEFISRMIEHTKQISEIKIHLAF